MSSSSRNGGRQTANGANVRSCDPLCRSREKHTRCLISLIRRPVSYLRATASKYGESHDSSENSDFFYCVKKTLLVNYFQKYSFKVPASSHFCEIWESSKYSSINQDGRWNLSKIVHFQHASTERRELAWISYSHSL